MAAIDEISILQKFTFFQVFRDDQLKLLSFGIEQITLKEGDFLFYEGDPASSAFILIDGKIEFSAIRNGVDSVLAEIGPDTLMSEMALITKVNYPNTAHAISDCLLLKVPHSAFRRLLNEFPDTVPILYNHIHNGFNKLRAKLNDLPKGTPS